MIDVVYAAGMFHDIGKFQQVFQHRINGENIKVEHSTCGSIVAKEKMGEFTGLLLAYCIAGHHSGIPDGGVDSDKRAPYEKSTLYARMNREFEDYSIYEKELEIPDVDEKNFQQFLLRDCGNVPMLINKFAFLVRYCFSCLTDADTIDTSVFCGTYDKRRMKANFKECLKRVNEKLDSFKCETELQKARRTIQRQVYDRTDSQGEIFLMNMPTGSGKTLCSVKFALEKTLKESKKRIIYVIPYNSIIDQTAEEFNDLFKEDAEILRHQSSFSYEDEECEESDSEDYRQAAKNAVVNWDAPFIITTAVQFFESVYSHKKRKLRKMHNMADSILIFDEAHLMPQKYLQPCLQAVSYITRYLNSKAVFLTATMPDFRRLIEKYALPSSEIVDLIEDASGFTKFKKCKFSYIGELTKDILVRKAKEMPSSLIIVNRKSTAKELYNLLGGKKYHLSTYLAACDRQKIIGDIKIELKRLEDDFPNLENVPEERRITIVSTSLIEAGVDIDMYSVFREHTGLDSILQAGGRCNREGKRTNAFTYIFELEECVKRISKDSKSNISKGLINKYEDISSAECILEYYEKLFTVDSDEIENSTIDKDCNKVNNIPFRTYGENFRIIDGATVSIVIDRDEESHRLIEVLKNGGIVDIRKLQKYVCSVRPWDLKKLMEQNVVEDYDSGIWCLTNMKYYDENTGIKFEGEDYYVD